MTSNLNTELKAQCSVQRERCLYTSASLFIWLRTLRIVRIVFIGLPILLSGIAGWKFLTDNQALLATALALIAGIVPAIYSALKLDDHLESARTLAGEYKNLEIIFADLEKVSSLKDFPTFEAEYMEARKRLELANADAYTAPEWCFRKAQEKVKAGHYTFTR